MFVMKLTSYQTKVLIYILFFSACFYSAITFAAQQASSEKKPPNIIWVVLEDISLDLGSYGNTLVHTPNLDRLAKEGTRYTNAYATSPVCSPTRSAFFTGMHQTSIGAHHHRSHLNDDFSLPKGIKMLSSYLRDAGYFNLLMLSLIHI